MELPLQTKSAIVCHRNFAAHQPRLACRIASQHRSRNAAFSVAYIRTAHQNKHTLACSAETAHRSRSPLRLIQHKEEAFWFYRFLSIVYDKIGMLLFQEQKQVFWGVPPDGHAA